MKGIILAGGSGTRLHPVTQIISKQLLPVYDKPMIYYPLSVLMLAGVRDILIITTPQDQANFKTLLGDGSNFGVSLTYATQAKPNGIAEAFIIGEDFIGEDSVCLVLGDNLFYGHGLKKLMRSAAQTIDKDGGAILFGYQVADPQRFGVLEFDDDLNVLSLEEKPPVPKSNYVATGLYFYDNSVIEIAKNIEPSKRGELEITSVSNTYLDRKNLSVRLLGRGYAWFDSGTHNSLLEASQFIQTIEKRQGVKISCIEEIALQLGWIDHDKLRSILSGKTKGSYYEYLNGLLN